ncbi:MAG: hypothetical protein HFE44_06425 [Oscillospiraceae bacterium]|jgi:mRNA-degrading endonuclease RelE of RelBE toxin-antitoxin system|nr:hypothetical protein [Oscillospiraceae bacterium]
MNFHKKVIKELARKEGVTKKEIRRRIQEAIAIAQQNPDPQIQNEWKKIHPGQGTPTPEEVIDYCVRAIKINH